MVQRKVAIVTGATSGIGIVIARYLVESGFNVAVVGRSATRGVVVAEQLGSQAQFFAADLSASGAARELVERVTEAFGRVDVLVNNAAIDHTNDLLEVGEDEIRAIFETNTFAVMNLLIAAANRMREQGGGGAIINITSRLASVGKPTMSIYSASKGAIHAFTKAAAVDLAPFNIRVNAVAPGMTRTPLYQRWLDGLPDPDAVAAEVAAAIPLGRIAEPEDIAAAVRFLASDEASYVTGASIPVEGGYLAT